jgi:CO/xanthine dehydrogenase Mo-binding subunit
VRNRCATVYLAPETADRFGWPPAAAASGRGQDVALGIHAGTCVDLAVEVEVDRSTGKVRVTRMVCDQAMGFAVTPARGGVPRPRAILRQPSRPFPHRG